MRREEESAEASSASGYTFSQLLDEKEQFLENLLGANELARIRKGDLTDENSFLINREFDSRKDLQEYWKSIIARFNENDPDLDVNRAYLVRDRAQYLIQQLFNPSNVAGLCVLMVGCYHVNLFNRDDVVEAVRLFLNATRADEYMMIAACNEEVMFEETQSGQYENRFLELIRDDLYADRVFPMKLPERPEFHFSGRLYKSQQSEDTIESFLGFETHHYEGHELRTRVESKSEANFRLAFRSFAHYVMDPVHVSQCMVERDLKLYKKHLPEFFFIYRQLPPYLRGRVHIDLSTVGQE